jgi:hypothetical protein
MSHFTTVQTQFTNKDILLKSLNKISSKFNFINIKSGSCSCRGYQGNQISVNILIQLSSGYDIGFILKNNTYEMVADWYGINNMKETELTSSLKQNYSLLTTRKELTKKGFSLKEEKLSNGTIRLVAKRLGGRF